MMIRCIYWLTLSFLLLSIFTGSALAATWALTYPPSGGSGLGQVIFPADSGNVIVAGEANAHGFIAKVNSSGQFVWQRTYGATVTSRFYDGCAVDSGYVLTGSILNGGVAYVWIMKIRPNGDSVWARSYGGNIAAEGYAIKRCLGGFIIAGKIGVAGRGDDAWVLRCNNNGDTLWTKKMGGTSDDKFTGVTVADSLGRECILVGSKSSNLQTDFWMTRLTDSSSVVWDSTYGGTLNDDGQDVAWTDFSIPFRESFNTTFPPTGWAIRNPDSSITWTQFSGTTNWARLNNSADTARGQTDTLVTSSISTTGLHSAEYTFVWSYAGDHIATNNDGLEFAYTADNGATWNTLWYRHAQDALSLVAGTAATDTTPATSNYGIARISLPSGALGQASVRFAFIGHNDNGPDIFVTDNIISSASYLAVGYSNTVTGSANNKNLYLKKIDQYGRTIWSRDYGVVPNEYGHRLQVNADGTFYVVGTSNSTDSQEGGSISLWKFTATGDSISQHTYGNTFNCIGRAMTINPSRDIYLTGAAGNLSGRNLILMKLDSTGTLTSSLQISPFTGSNFRVNDTTTFHWHENLPGAVRIELNRAYPSGAWTTLVNNSTADSLRWVITTPTAPICKIRATLTGFGDSITVVSDSSFAIVQPSVHVVSPNGGELLPIGSIQPITWTSQFLRGEHIVISLQRGTNTPTPLDTEANANGTYNWTVSGIPANNYKVILNTIGGNIAATDQSDTTFQIVNRLHITHPTANQGIQVGVNDTIRWISANVPDSIIVELKRNYPSGTWEVLGIAPNNPGFFIWSPNLPLSGNTAIRISTYPSLAIRDTSAIFQILRPTISVTFPNGGEHFQASSLQDIQWNSANVTGLVSIQLNRNYPDSTHNWETLFASTANDGEQLWVVTGPATVRARIRITSTFNPTVSDTSDNNFEIIDTTDAVSEQLPKSFVIGAYPNPFNSQIRIGYQLERATTVTMSVFDITGREVYHSVKGKLAAGYHVFDWNAGNQQLAAGIYYCQIHGDGVSKMYKLAYIK